MKHLLLLVVLYTTFSLKGFACGPFDRNFLARDYFLFRACGENMSGKDRNLIEERARANCIAWANLTSSQIPIDDIYEVVYWWTRSSMDMINWEIKLPMHTIYPNHFERWIVNNKDLEILDFLKLAKECEYIRAKQNSLWYYPVDGDANSIRLEQIIETSISYQGKRLRDRYTLQAIRALFTLQQYGECINLWLERQGEFSNSVIKDMIVDYVAGCYIRLKQPEKAAQLYLYHGNLEIAIHNGILKKNSFDSIYKHDPDNVWLINYMQQKIHELESHNESEWDIKWDMKDYNKLYTIVTKVCKENKCKNMVQWYYTRAFLAIKLQKSNEAKKYINLADKLAKNKELSNAIRVLKLYISSLTTKTYNADFETYLYGELQWLDEMIATKLDDSIREHIVSHGIQNHLCGESQYYWNDVMRKILIGNIVPLCLKSNNEVRALQFLNYADNRIFNLVGDVASWVPNPSESEVKFKPYVRKIISWTKYRSRENEYNKYDYRNDFFIVLDSIGVKPIKQLLERYQQPQSSLDRFLCDRSYSDKNFLNDIIGTQLLASMKYTEAIEYLSKVPATFNQSRNIFPRCNIEPFTGKKMKQPDNFYRLNFAKKMSSLEQQIAKTKDENNKAKLMLTYARGLQHSIDEKGWVLTSFYRGEFYGYPFYSNYQQQMINAIADRASHLVEKSLNMFTDREMAAKAHYDWRRYKTAVKKYPETKTATYIKGHCDQLRDYKVLPKTWL